MAGKANAADQQWAHAMTASGQDERGKSGDNDDAMRAIKFLAIKAAIFMLIPALAAVAAVYFTLK